MDLSIIVVNWNSVKYLQECLRSVYRQTTGLEFEVIVLDSGSFDGCGEMLGQKFPAVGFVQSDKNLGFARGNNLAASYSSGNVLLFLNPDTQVSGSALKILYDSILSLPDAGVVGARLLNSDGSLQTSCLQTFPTIINQLLDTNLLRQLFPNARLWGMSSLFAETCAPLPVEGISGACLMTRRDVFQSVGGFSEDYFLYYEDMDYCLKVVRAGWKNYFIPTAVVIHHGGKSSGGTYSRLSTVIMRESAWRFLRKQRGHNYAGLFRVGLAIKAGFLCCLFGMASVATCFKTRHKRVTGGLRKWTYVLRWCLGLERSLAGHH